ncbi:SPOR domain-containing protein [Sulfurirhabdus autotrophica]|uniref:Sporulation related protein n=1 Tax=Sulfurirhabdus autotrophica TaxID=1706046 RepID=A0A4R3XZC1_9PROT|nr:SPOR domain-containing protein [Sulfurirhabdus autotrophica]TCV83043.1 sporulation related protein [Sulfurirhabdus autotrophica]
MKGLFVILFLANIAFFGLVQLATGQGGEPTAEHRPLSEDKVILVDPPAPADAAKINSSPQQAPVTASVCLEWGMFSGKVLGEVQTELQKLQLGDRVKLLNLEEINRYWVYIPPQKTKLEADKKIAELKGHGIEDYLLIQDEGKWRYSISLGVFSKEEAADKLLAQLKQKGVKSAKAGPRMHSTGETKIIVKDVTDELAAKLVVLKQVFQGSELKAIACK